MNRLSKRGGRLAAVLILLAFIGLLAAVLLLPLLGVVRHYDDTIAGLQFRLGKYRHTAALVEGLKQHLEQLTERQRSDEGLLQGESSAIAGASLQALLKQGIQKAGGRLESTQILPVQVEGPMERIAIRARLSGDIQALQKILYTFEYGKTMLFIDALEISTRSARRRRKTGTPERPTLKVSLEVSGFRRSGDAG